MEEMGMVTLMPMNPIRHRGGCSVTDPDVVMEDSVMWPWSKSMTMDGTFMDIEGTTSMAYTPMDGRPLHLRATATYTDGYDSGNVATHQCGECNNAGLRDAQGPWP